MTDCEALRDQMPDVAHGIHDWTSVEAAHLSECDSCAAEWYLVQQAAALHADLRVDADTVSAQLLSRLRAEPSQAPIRRIRWRGAATVLTVAIAASLILILRLPHHAPARAIVTGDTETLAVLPGLQGLTDQQLENIRGAIAPGMADTATAVVPHLGELTDGELEQLLRQQGGE